MKSPEKARALPVFHALTGCDTVSSFAGHGEKTAWAVWAVFPELTNALLELCSALHDIPQEVMATIERFIILLYDRTSTSTEIDHARRKLFAKRHKVQSIPPTKAALSGQSTREAMCAVAVPDILFCRCYGGERRFSEGAMKLG